MRLSLSRHDPVTRSLVGTGTLGIPLAVILLIVVWLLGAVGSQLAINFLVALIAVVGFGIYSGNSGIMTFGHVAFVGVAAYASGLLTVPPAIKRQSLPNLPDWLLDTHLSMGAAMAVAIGVVALVAVLFGIPFARLSAGATPISTFAMLLIVYVVLVGAKDVTRGSQTFYGVPSSTTLWIGFVAAVIVIFVARMFRESVFGLRLQASREDELASKSSGVSVARLRFAAWVLSAVVVAVAGVLMGHELTAFSPKQFYIPLQFMYVAMLVVGGQATVTGSVVGALTVSVLLELARRFEGLLHGLSVFGYSLEGVFGLQEVTLGLLIMAVMFWRRDGLFDFDELDDRLRTIFRRRRVSRSAAASTDPVGAST
jgi:branched-chain amino acid transport system permease protein